MCNSFLTHVDQSMVSNTMYTFKNRRRRKRHETGGNRIDAELGSVWGGRACDRIADPLLHTQKRIDDK